jgi:hypothetical protein
MTMKSPHVRTRKIIENSRVAGMGRGLNAHRLVAEMAVNIAEELFDPYIAANNGLYKVFKEHLTEKQARAIFVAKIAPICLEEARLALVDCLAQPDDVCSAALKEEIFEALELDNHLRANRSVAPSNAVMN